MNSSMPLVRPYLQVTWVHHPHGTLMIMLFEKGGIIFAIFSFPKSTNQVVIFSLKCIPPCDIGYNRATSRPKQRFRPIGFKTSVRLLYIIMYAHTLIIYRERSQGLCDKTTCWYCLINLKSVILQGNLILKSVKNGYDFLLKYVIGRLCCIEK